jgi:hypothetical protein
MSAPNQFKVTLNRHRVKMKEKGPSWTVMYDDTMSEVFHTMNKAGIVVYYYLIKQIPHYYDKEKNLDNKKPRPFEFSPKAVMDFSGMDQDSIRNGWKELLQLGYIKHISGNKYYFTDNLNVEKFSKYKNQDDDDEILTIEEIYPEKEEQQLSQQKTQEHHYDWE